MRILAGLLGALVIALAGCSPSDTKPYFDTHEGRYVAVGDAPGGAVVVMDRNTGRCFVVSRSYSGYNTAVPAPDAWCRR